MAVPNVNNVAILLGTGTGSFLDASFYGAGYHLRSVAVGDFDEDSHGDMAVANGGTDDVTILLGNLKEIDVEIDCDLDSVPQGESLPFTVTITNETDTTVTFELTLYVKLIGGPELLFFGPRTITLYGGHEVIRNPSVGVPVNAPIGDFILTLEARSLTNEVLDEDSFRVTVVGRKNLDFFSHSL